MQFLLRLKHWQLFLIQFGIPIVLYFIMMCLFVSSIIGNTNPSPSIFGGFFWIFPIIMIVSLGSLFGWMWSIGTGFQKLIPEHFRLKTTLFKAFLILPAVYFVFFAFFVFYTFKHDIVGPHTPQTDVYPILMIFPFHLF